MFNSTHVHSIGRPTAFYTCSISARGDRFVVVIIIIVFVVSSLLFPSVLRLRRPTRWFSRLWYDRDLVVDLQWFQQRVARSRWRRPTTTTTATTATTFFAVHHALRNDTVRRVYMILELFVHAERCGAHCALVGQVSWLQRHSVVTCHVVQ